MKLSSLICGAMILLASGSVFAQDAIEEIHSMNDQTDAIKRLVFDADETRTFIHLDFYAGPDFSVNWDNVNAYASKGNDAIDVDIVPALEEAKGNPDLLKAVKEYYAASKEYFSGVPASIDMPARQVFSNELGLQSQMQVKKDVLTVEMKANDLAAKSKSSGS